MLLQTIYDLEESVRDLSVRELQDLSTVVTSRLRVAGIEHECDDCAHLSALSEAENELEDANDRVERIETEASGLVEELRKIVKALGGHDEVPSLGYVITRLERLAL